MITYNFHQLIQFYLAFIQKLILDHQAKIFPVLMGPKNLSPYSQERSTRPYPEFL
jgi:hypothetical protein